MILDASEFINLNTLATPDGDEYLLLYDPDGGASRYAKKILISNLSSYIKQNGGYIEIEFEFEFDGTAGKGLNASAITVPTVVIPDNFILISRVLDFSADLEATDDLATLSIGIAVNGATTLLTAASANLALAGAFEADAITPIKTTAARAIVMAVAGTGDITAGTVKGILRGYIGL